MAAWAEILGFVQEYWSRLRVITAWGTRQPHSWEGKLAPQEASPAQRRFLNEVNVVLAEGFLHGVGEYIVKDVESGGCITLVYVLVACRPGCSYPQGFLVFEKVGEDGFGVVIAEGKYVLVLA